MANRDNHYEAAFEEFLRVKQIPYVAVDETKRALLGDASLKSLDFIVSTALGVSWLVDVKGTAVPSRGAKAVLEKLVDSRRFAEPDRLAAIVRPIISRAFRFRL